MQKNTLSYLPFLLVLLSFVLKLVHINTFAIQHDEPFSIFTAQLNGSEFWNVFMKENNPPLHPILLKLLIECVGMDEFWMRCMSVLFASVAVYFLYKAVEKIANWQAATVAGLCLVFSNLQMIYAHQIRAYALLLFLACVSLYFFIKIIKQESKHAYVFFGLVNALMLYTHFMGIIYVGFMSFSLLVFRKEAYRNKLFWSFALTFLCFAPYLPLFITRLLWVNTAEKWLPLAQSPITIYFIYWRFFNAPLLTIISLLVLIFGLFYIFLKLKKDNKLLIFFCLQIIMAFVGVFIISYKIPIYDDRYLIFIAPILYATLALIFHKIISSIPDIPSKNVIWLILPLLFIVTFKIKNDLGKDKNEHWQMVKNNREGKIVVISPAWEDLNYTYFADKDKYYMGSEKKYFDVRIQDEIFFDYEFIAKHWNIKNRIFLVSSPDNNYRPELKNVLDTKCDLIKIHSPQLAEYKLR